MCEHTTVQQLESMSWCRHCGAICGGDHPDWRLPEDHPDWRLPKHEQYEARLAAMCPICNFGDPLPIERKADGHKICRWSCGHRIEQKDTLTDDEIELALRRAESYLAGGNSPPLRPDTTPMLARTVRTLYAHVEKMRPVYNLARRWCNRPEDVLREGGEVFANDAALWIELRKRVAAAALVEPNVAAALVEPNVAPKDDPTSTLALALLRDQRQTLIADWACKAFGEAEATDISQRALRLLEEAIEAFQACKGDEALALKLVKFVFARPPGWASQELGGVAVTILALAAALGVSADQEECREINRVLSKPISEFTARNERKNAAGFRMDLPKLPCPWAGCPTPESCNDTQHARNTCAGPEVP